MPANVDGEDEQPRSGDKGILSDNVVQKLVGKKLVT